MNLISLDFLNIIILFFGIGLLLVSYRLLWFLAFLSERMIVFMAQTGMRRLARSLLVVLVGYNQHTYYKSRFILWNQVHVRFALLWGGVLLTAAALCYLYAAHRIDSVFTPLAILLTVFLGIRCLLFLTKPKSKPQAWHGQVNSLSQDVNEQVVRQVIRRWDYLDELYGIPL